MRKRVRAENGNSSVEVVLRRRGSEPSETVIKREEQMMESEKKLCDNPAVVGVTKKLTMNIGNYESVAVSVHFSMPCNPDSKSVNEMYDKVNSWVDCRIETERQLIRKSTGA